MAERSIAPAVKTGAPHGYVITILQLFTTLYGEMAERSIASDCKSDASRLRRFKSYSPQIIIYHLTIW